MVRVVWLRVGDLYPIFSSSEPSNSGSASTVTLILHGLIPPGRPVCIVIDFVGEGKSTADISKLDCCCSRWVLEELEDMGALRDRFNAARTPLGRESV